MHDIDALHAFGLVLAAAAATSVAMPVVPATHLCMAHDHFADFSLLQVRQSAAQRYQAEMQAAAAAAAAAAGIGHGGYRGLRLPPGYMPPGYDPADTVRVQPHNAGPGPAAPPAAGNMQPPGPAQRAYDVGQAMAQVLLSMPMPRWPGRGAGGGGARRDLPPGLAQMRDAVLGMQRAGLPPHLLFSDRDFTAGGLQERAHVACGLATS